MWSVFDYKYIDDFSKILLKKNVTFTLSSKAKKLLIDIGFHSAMGARSVHRTINNHFKKS